MATFLKGPDALLPFTWDWTGWLTGEGNDAITAISITAETGLTVDSSSFQGGSVTAWLSGGTTGQTYTITCHVTTTSGRQDDRSITVEVVER